MNTQQGCRDCGSRYNTLASILGTALYRSMSGADTLGRSGGLEKRRAKSRLGLRLGFKVR